jgi:lysophospholipase L1-like esterase
LLKRIFDKELHSKFAENIRKICVSHGVSFFDMNAALSDSKLDEKWLFVDRVHLTDEGSRIVAEIINRDVMR